MTTPADSLAVLDGLGLRPVINASDAVTRLGGSVLAPEVRAAMDAAAQHYMPLAEMQERASEVIAGISGAEAGCVATGAGACLFLATVACMVGEDRAAMDRLPVTTGMSDEVVIHRAHRNPFDHVLRATGARLVEFGYLTRFGGVGTYRWQLEAALTDRTAAVYYLRDVYEQVLPLRTVVEIAHERGVPVIVDAADVRTPDLLRAVIADGADLVAVSGGKAVAGPAASGFLAGRRDLVRAATLQQQDMFVFPDLWQPPMGTGEGATEPPHQGLGRTMKVGREEIAGLLAALGRWPARDPDAELGGTLAVCERIAAALRGIDGVATSISVARAAVVVQLSGPDAALEAARTLLEGDPRVFLFPMWIPQGQLGVMPRTVRPEQVEPLIQRLREVLGSLPSGAS
jgi:L-seryl-tRNA(Ser) seleniumtransferase